MSQYNPNIVTTPKHTVIEKVALEMACVWYETGRSQGLTSKWPNARSFARDNFVKFIPKAIEILTDMLGRQDIHDLMKQEIYDALMERVHDPRMTMGFDGKLPDIDIKKLLATMPEPLIINTVIDKVFGKEKKPLPNVLNNPFKKVN